jgi:hypothetical protein
MGPMDDDAVSTQHLSLHLGHHALPLFGFGLRLAKSLALCFQIFDETDYVVWRQLTKYTAILNHSMSFI